MTDFAKLKVADLRAELKRRGLPQTGLKGILVARLEAAENEDGSESENTVQDDQSKLETASAASPNTVSPILPSPEVSAGLENPPESLETTNIETAESTALSVGEDVTAEPAAVTVSPLAPQPESDVVSQPAVKSRPAEVDVREESIPFVESQEAIDDRQKRKRRSGSPSISATDAARKRFRTSPAVEDECVDALTASGADFDLAIVHNAVREDEMDVVVEGTHGMPHINERENLTDAVIADATDKSMADTMNPVDSLEPESTTEEGAPDDATRQRDSHFKNLFSGQSNQDEHMVDEFRNEAEQDRVTSPAMHPATSALYIRDIMRPLNPSTLKTYIVSLAAAPGHQVDEDVITEFYIDQIRTHAFVSFTTVSAASRVRSALHDRIWPDERTRKPLWVDFVPVNKLEAWIETEQLSHTSRTLGRKWEVVYEMDNERNVTVALQDVTNLPRPNTSLSKTGFAQPQPRKVSEPLAIEEAQPDVAMRGTTPPVAVPLPNSQLHLDQLFSKTTAKPHLYFKPVSREIADRRLDALDALVSKKIIPGQVIEGPINRYTFEEDKLVDRGPEIFGGLRPPPGFRGPAFGNDGDRSRGDRSIRGDPRGFGGRGGRGFGGRGGYGAADRDYRGGDRRGFGGDRVDRGGYSQNRDTYRSGGPDRNYRNDRRSDRDFERR